jgi:hypothetical protein
VGGVGYDRKFSFQVWITGMPIEDSLEKKPKSQTSSINTRLLVNQDAEWYLAISAAGIIKQGSLAAYSGGPGMINE